MHELGLLDEFLNRTTAQISVDLGHIFQMHDRLNILRCVAFTSTLLGPLHADHVFRHHFFRPLFIPPDFTCCAVLSASCRCSFRIGSVWFVNCFRSASFPLSATR